MIRGGLIFDGFGKAPYSGDVVITGNRITAVVRGQVDPSSYDEVIEASGRWVTPGFLEVHSHYDGELLISPGLPESVRHGVTTVVVGSCSLSAVLSSPDDCADLFARVEAVPHDVLLGALERHKTWSTPMEYRDWVDSQPLGPNISAILGHSDLRASTMGLERSTTGEAPTPGELDTMEATLDAALDAGFLGLSTMTTKLDKVAGDRAWSRSLPSTYASWGEYRRLNRLLRKRGAILQSAPDASLPVNLVHFLAEGSGFMRKPLKTSLLTSLDMTSNRLAHVLTRTAGAVANRVLRGNLRFQTLPSPMKIRGDGLHFNSFEEFSSGQIIQDLKNHDDRYELAKDPEFRATFVKEVDRLLVVGLWDRNIAGSTVIHCPDRSLEGKTFASIGKERGCKAAEAFLDLAVEFREQLTWEVMVANDRPKTLERLLSSDYTQIGFADSGAHLRTLAFYNFGIRALTIAARAEKVHDSRLTVAKMVRRLTGELAEWFGIAAGHIEPGAQADLVIIDPAGLNDDVFEFVEVWDENFSLDRLVNRNDAAVDAVLINGRVAYRTGGGCAADLGAVQYGTFLPAVVA